MTNFQKLPEIGQPCTADQIRSLALMHKKYDVVEALSNPPDDIFVSDGCTSWPDEWRGYDLYSACFWHDVRYWCGMPNDDLGRLRADAHLMLDVAQLVSIELGEVMFAGVRVGGGPHWGRGR